MSARELDRLEVLGRVAERRLSQQRAATQLGLSERQVRRLCRALVEQGAAGLVSRKRGRPSNRMLPAAVRDEARTAGITQFGRALSELNIDIVCANTPQAEGRVERAHLTLQERLVKELRLRGISTPEAGNAFLPEFRADYNARFACAPRCAHDAHRPLRDDEDLERIFTWQEERKLSRDLTLHYKRGIYLVEPGPETLRLAGARCRVHESEDGHIEVFHAGQRLPCRLFYDKDPHVTHGAIVAHKRLGAVLTQIQAEKHERDRQRLARASLTLRQKDRIRAAQVRASGMVSSPAGG